MQDEYIGKADAPVYDMDDALAYLERDARRYSRAFEEEEEARLS